MQNKIKTAKCQEKNNSAEILPTTGLAFCKKNPYIPPNT
jgi:hypothetical protein